MAKLTTPPSAGNKPPADGMVRLDAAFRRPDGSPRFSMTLPRSMLNDGGVRVMANEEARQGGYEYPSRLFVDTHLEPGDLFIDVGAHWGIYTLQAATRHPDDVRVMSVEPHPGNVQHLRRGVLLNKLGDHVEIISGAAGARFGTAPLVLNTSMGNSLHGVGLPDWAARTGTVTVPVLPLDGLMDERPDLAGRRVILKIDAEGFEPEVIEGATELLDSGRVAAVVWEHGRAFFAGERHEAMLVMEQALNDRGFSQYQFPHPVLGGPLIPFAPTPESFNVFALAPDVRRHPAYTRPKPRPETMPKPCQAPDDPIVLAAATETVIRRRTTHAARWGNFEALRAGADARARMAAPHVPPGASILDLGAGVMALRGLLPPGCRYMPADLVPFDAATVVVDLNDGGFPEGRFDAVVALEVLEYLHDAAGILRAARSASNILLVSYRSTDALPVAHRRQQGMVNDHAADEMEAMLAAAGWAVAQRVDGAAHCGCRACSRRRPARYPAPRAPRSRGRSHS